MRFWLGGRCTSRLEPTVSELVESWTCSGSSSLWYSRVDRHIARARWFECRAARGVI